MSHPDIAAAFRDEIETITESLGDPLSDEHTNRVANRAAQIIQDWSVYEAFILATLLFAACGGESAVASPDPSSDDVEVS